VELFGWPIIIIYSYSVRILKIYCFLILLLGEKLIKIKRKFWTS
jgi:hypothetical protein